MMRLKDPTEFRALLRRRGLRQAELARRVKMSRAQLSMIIAGSRRITEADADAIAAELAVRRSTVFAPSPDQRQVSA